MLNTLWADVYMPARPLAGVFDEVFVSELHAPIVHLDLKGVVGVVISNSLSGLWMTTLSPSSNWSMDVLPFFLLRLSL